MIVSGLLCYTDTEDIWTTAQRNPPNMARGKGYVASCCNVVEEVVVLTGNNKRAHYKEFLLFLCTSSYYKSKKVMGTQLLSLQIQSPRFITKIHYDITFYSISFALDFSASNDLWYPQCISEHVQRKPLLLNSHPQKLLLYASDVTSLTHHHYCGGWNEARYFTWKQWLVNIIWCL